MVQAPRVLLLMIPFAGYDRGLLEGIGADSQLHGPWVFYLSGDYPEGPVPATDSLSQAFTGREYMSSMVATAPLPNLRRWGASGAIGRFHSAKIARKILATGMPVIGIDLSDEHLRRDNPLSRISEIRAASHEVGRMAAEHFLDRGFRHFAFFGYPSRNWSQRRLEGFDVQLRQAGFACDAYHPARLRQGLTWEWEERMVISWLMSLPRPVAIFASSDVRGRQVLEACLLAGLRVPDDVAVVGADDDHLICNLSNPPLSSVAFDLEQAGYRAAEFLDGLMRGTDEAPHTVMVDPLWVVTRRSSDMIATDDRHVAAALRFIRDHARDPIDVHDVVHQAGISRRGLEIRFRRSMGRSLREEIQRSRSDLRQAVCSWRPTSPRGGSRSSPGSAACPT